jgi:tRNA(Phe) wybutosine-synthesizing methylase Tyw3
MKNKHANFSSLACGNVHCQFNIIHLSCNYGHTDKGYFNLLHNLNHIKVTPSSCKGKST